MEFLSGFGEGIPRTGKDTKEKETREGENEGMGREGGRERDRVAYRHLFFPHFQPSSRLVQYEK